MPYSRIAAGDVGVARGPSQIFFPISKSTEQDLSYPETRAIILGNACNEATFMKLQGTVSVNELIACIPVGVYTISLGVTHLNSGVTYGGETIAAVTQAEIKTSIDQLLADMIPI